MLARLRSRWQNRKHYPYATGFVVVLVVVLLVFIFLAYRFGWDWTGFTSGTNQITITSTSKGSYTALISQPAKSLWDWLNLFGVLAIPAVVGLGAVWFTAQQARASDAENTNSQRETVLQGYINKLSELHLGGYFEEPHPEYERARTIARARTLTLLPLLDGKRKTSLVRFLYESHLLKTIDLHGADLSHAELHEKDLSHINLSYADLSHTKLTRSKLQAANLSSTKLTRAVVKSADLSEANLSDADLSEADLTGAKVTVEQLAKARSLEGAIMTDGTKHV